MFQTWGASVCPLYARIPPVFQMPAPIFSNIPHMSPMLPCVSLCSRGFLHVVRGCRRPFLCLDTTHVLDASPCVNNPHAFVCSPVCLYVLGVVSMCYGETPICWGSGGHQHICQAFGVCQYIHWMSIMLHLVPFL